MVLVVVEMGGRHAALVHCRSKGDWMVPYFPAGVQSHLGVTESFPAAPGNPSGT